MIEKILAIITAIWFYQSAKKTEENPIKWSLIGIVGFFLVALITHFAIAEPILESFESPSKTTRFLFGNIPGAVGFIVAFFIKRKFLAATVEE